MIRFIALTEMPVNRTVLINVAAIVYVTKGRKEDTYIRVNTGAAEAEEKGLRNFYFFVKEPVAEIQKMLIPSLPIMNGFDDEYLPDDGRHRNDTSDYPIDQGASRL